MDVVHDSRDGHNLIERFQSLFSSQSKSADLSSSCQEKNSHENIRISSGSGRSSQIDFDVSTDDEAWDENPIIEDTNDQIPQATTSVSLPKPNAQELIEAEINYILETEDRYLKMLLSMEEDRNYLGMISPPFFRKWLSQLFRQVKPLTTLHETLLTSLASAKFNIALFADSFMDLKKQLYIYIYYIENIPVVDKLIVEYTSFLKDKTPDLIDKLRLPRLRLNHYVLMLESLQKKVAVSDKIHLQNVIELCKKYLTEADKALLLGTITGCPFHMSDYGNLVHNSDLKLVDAPDLPRNRHHVVLLQRKFIILSGNRDQYRFVYSLPLDEISLKSDARGLYFSIIIKQKEKNIHPCYTFKAKNIKVQQVWLEKLRGAMDQIVFSLKRNEGRASFGRSGKRGRELRRKFSVSKTKRTCSADDDSQSDDDSPKQYWINRRKEKKKFASFNSRETGTKKVLLQSSVSDGEENFVQLNHGMAPLTVWNFFDNLETLYRILRDCAMNVPYRKCEGIANTIVNNKFLVLNVLELNYVKNLHRQVAEFNDTHTTKPPKEIRNDLLRLHEFHKNAILPSLEQFENIEQGFLETLNDQGDAFTVLYSEYLIDRCIYHEEIYEMELADQYIAPIRHFIEYCQFVIQMKKEGHHDQEFVAKAAEVLHDTITNANNYLLSESIINVPFALSQCQPILLVGQLKMKHDSKSRQEYQLVLVEDQLIILEIKPPLYNYHSALRLDSVCLGPSADCYHFQLEYRASATLKKVYSFWAPRKEIRDRWTGKILKILASQARKLKETMQQRLEKAPSQNVGLSVPSLHTIDLSRSPSIQKKMFDNRTPLETDL